MKPEDIPKITSLSQRTRQRHDPKHHGIEGPFWRGHYRENGKRVTVHIGRLLPTPLLALLKRAYRKPGAKQLTWPKPGEKP